MVILLVRVMYFEVEFHLALSLHMFCLLTLEENMKTLLLKCKAQLLLFCDNLFVRQGTSNRPYIREVTILRKFSIALDDLLTVAVELL